jgi:hypothetical protein
VHRGQPSVGALGDRGGGNPRRAHTLLGLRLRARDIRIRRALGVEHPADRCTDRVSGCVAHAALPGCTRRMLFFTGMHPH